MPIYEYRCDGCGHEMEAIQKMADAALTDCPQCQQALLKKKISAVGFRLKGQGWYETDFKGKNQKYGTQKKEGADKTGKPAEKKSTPSSSGNKPKSS